MKLKTNEAKLVEFVHTCKPGLPKCSPRYLVGHDGKTHNIPGIGGITLNVEVGDSAFGWEGDHIEPSVSAINNGDKPFEWPNKSLQFLTCVGNEATLLSGKAKGKKGVVIGHHGGSEHLIIDFPREVRKKMTYEDNISIHTRGVGLKLLDYPTIKCMNLDPKLLHKMKITKKGKKLTIPVTTIVPAACMGSGLGMDNMHSGDYDIMTSDQASIKKYHLDQIRFGDFVAILDHDNTYGPSYKSGSLTIGIVVHSDCVNSGHGPGVTPLLSCLNKEFEPILDRKANIADLLRIGIHRRK
jgi:Domain of unknown function (DUF4438)